VIVISSASLKSQWVKQELSAAVVREIERRTTLVIPIVLGAVAHEDIPVTLRAKRYIAMRRVTEQNYTRGLAELLSTLGTTSDVGEGDTPVFSCPPFASEVADKLTDVHMSILDLIMLENAVDSDWYFEAKSGEAHLVFHQDDRTSRPIRFALGSTDRERLTMVGSRAEMWRSFSRRDEQNGILKLQYRVKRKGYVALYWINYAVERYLESRLREFCHDWDMEVTLRARDV
jgi:hypothetical protein